MRAASIPVAVGLALLWACDARDPAGPTSAPLLPLPSHSVGVDLPFMHPVPSPASLDDRTCNLGIFGGPLSLPLIHGWNVRVVGATGPRTIRVATQSGTNDRGILRAKLLDLSNSVIAAVDVPYTGVNATGDIVATLSAGVYRLTFEAVPTTEPPPAQSGQHYTLGGSPGVELGWAGPVTYGEGSGPEGHRWAINAAGGELVGVSLSVHSTGPPGVPPQATSVTYEVRNADGSPGPVPPTTMAVSPSSPVVIGFSSPAPNAYRLSVIANAHYTLHKATGDPGFYGMGCQPLPPPPPQCGGIGQEPCPPPPCTDNCTVNKQSQTDVAIFVDPGTPLPLPGEGLLPPPVPPQGVAPGTHLVARVHVNSVEGGEGIAGPFEVALLRPDGSIQQSWNVSSGMQGHVDVYFPATLPVGTYRLIAKFLGSTRIGPDGVTTIYSESSGEGSYRVAVPNTPPVANAGPDQEVFRTSPAGTTVTLDGSASSDAEGPIAEYAWFLVFAPGVPEQSIGTGVTLQRLFPLGFHNVRLRVTDAGGISRDDFMSVRVKNVPPVANAGPDQVRECVAGGVVATLDGSLSSDLDGTITSYKWFGLGNPAGVPGQTAQTFPLFVGDFQFTLDVTDNDGARAFDHVQVRVEDTQGPTIHMTVSPTTLWSPNHEMVRVASGAYATDACGSSVLGITITSNEPINGPGDGNTDIDWNVVANGNGTYDVWVRAERSGNLTGRIYTITATAEDGSGNVSTETVTVEVPHNRR